MAPWRASAITILRTSMSRCSESGGSSASMTPQTASKSFFERRPAKRPATMLNGMKRNFIAPGNVYPPGGMGTRQPDMSTRADSDTEINASGNGGAPDDPTDLKGRNWKQLLKRTVKEFQDDDLTDWAAALTYYALLALFPALLVLVALLGIVGQQSTIDTFISSMRDAGLSGAADNIQKPLNDVVNAKGGAGALFGLGLAGAIWSSSGYL